MINCWLETGGRRFPLRDGVNVIGRGPMANIQLESPLVARMHARVWVKDGEVLIGDNGSPGGTYVQDLIVRVGHPKQLADGDRIRIADVELTFRMERVEG